MTKPIKPSEVTKLKTGTIPAEVFAAFNECIAKHWDGRRSRFTQDAVIASVLGRMPTTERHTLFENKWLDVEDCYRGEGWLVDYEKPGDNEPGPAVFTFTARSKE